MKIDGLEELEKCIFQHFDYIGFPSPSWIIPDAKFIDVGIIGAGMAGIAAAFALLSQGILDFQLFDSAYEGEEGPWVTYARMQILRSGKELTGPANAFPLLTFEAWYEAQFGELKWQELYKIPRAQWMEYLNWFRNVLNLPVNNGYKIEQIDCSGSSIQLIFSDQSISVRKLILATGRGLAQIPAFMAEIPKEYYSHTLEKIDLNSLKGKDLCVIGAGASAFDISSTALEEGASSATILLRRKDIPRVNKGASLTYPGFLEGYYYLQDKVKMDFMKAMRLEGTPPPHEALDRIRKHSNFKLEKEVEILNVKIIEGKVCLETTKGLKFFDYLILATGFKSDVLSQPLLQTIVEKILVWGDKYPTGNIKFDSAPYLGPHFQFLSTEFGKSDFLNNIYCFNHSAAMSHGIISSDIPGIGLGAARLARGIAIDFFCEQSGVYLERLRSYTSLELPYELV